MSSRQFTDSQGTKWRVWSTVPSPASLLSAEYARGWLTFDSATSRKRLAPIPNGWENTGTDRLELMCRAAEEVAIHTGPIPAMNKDVAEPVVDSDPDVPPAPPANEPWRPPAA
jgi:hypothetical protein